MDECPASLELVEGGDLEGCGQNTVNAPVIPGWTVGGKVDWWKDSGLDGYAVDLSGSPGPGSLTQTLTTVPGARYDVLVDARPNDGAGPKTTTVVLKAGSTSKAFQVKSKTVLKLSFVANGPLTKLSLTSLDQGKYGTYVDNISVVRSDLVAGGGFDGCNGNIPNATKIPGWTVKGGVDWWSKTGLDGCAVDLSGTPGPGAISKTLTTVPGWEYQFRVDANPNLAGGSTAKSLTLRAGTKTQEFLLTEKGTLALNFVAATDATEIELAAARAWVEHFVQWYNSEHLHSAIRFVTPDARHFGLDLAQLAQRRKTYELARAKHPERWSRASRNWEPILIVTLNPERDSVVPEPAKQTA